MMALHEKGFTSPTKIQAAALPFAFAGRDVVGVAQTVGLSDSKWPNSVTQEPLILGVR